MCGWRARSRCRRLAVQYSIKTKAFTGHGFSLQKRTLALDRCTGSPASFFPTVSDLDNQRLTESDCLLLFVDMFRSNPAWL